MRRAAKLRRALLGDTREAEALCIPMHRCKRWNGFNRLRDGDLGISRAELGGSPSRLLQATSIGVGCGEKAIGPHGARLLREGLLGPLHGFIVVPLGEMG